MAAILNSPILNSAILDSAILHKTLTQTNSIWLKLIHSHSMWWWQPSWILPCWIQTLPSWIQRPSYLLSDSLKNTLPPLWLLTQTNSFWLKLIHSDSTWWWQPSWILPCWIKKTSLFILTQLDDGSHLELCHVGFRHLVFFSQIHSKTLSFHSDSDSN